MSAYKAENAYDRGKTDIETRGRQMAERKILVVDDEEGVANLFRQIFERDGYTVRIADSGEKALDLLENETIYVMFIDLNMPGMDGIELCREIKKNSSLTVLFAITGYSSLFELAECREAGFEDYFKKPVEISILREVVKAAFEKVERWKKT